MRLNEGTLTSHVDQLYERYGSWLKVSEKLQLLAEEEVKKEAYNSIEYNYLPIFLHYLIEKEISHVEFESVIKSIYNSKSNDLLSSCFSRFFKGHGIDDLSKNSIGKSDNIWENIYLCFLSYEDEKVIFNKKRLPYLLLLLNNFDESNIFSLHEGCFVSYCLQMFESNMEELVPIFNIKNVAFNKEELKKHKSIFGAMINLVANNSYNKKDNVNKDMFIFLNKHIDLISTLQNEIICFADYRSVKIDPAIVRFSQFGGDEIVNLLLKHISNVFNEQYNTNIKLGFTENSYLLNEVTCSLEIFYEKIQFNLDLKNININADIIENMVYITLLNVNIGNVQKMDKDLLEYLTEKLVLNSDNLNEEIFTYKKNNFSNLITYLNYNLVMDDLESIEIKKKLKNKI